MAIQITERQHFVPRAYLKNFSEKKGSAHYNIRALPAKDLRVEAIIERNTKSICYEKHLYTQPGTTAEEKMLLETFYAESLEDKYENVYGMLTDVNKTTLTDEERELIIATVATMFYRVPTWIKKHNDLIGRVFQMAKQASEHFGKEETSIEGDKYVLTGKSIEQLVKEYERNNKHKQVITQLKVAIGLIKLRVENDNIYIAKLEDGDAEFITSDNPVVLQNLKSPEIIPTDPTNIMKLPLDNKHCLMLMPDGKKENRNMIVRNNPSGGFSNREELISNTEQLSQADEFILGSTTALTRFVNIKDNPIELTSDEKDFEKRLFELGKANGWI